MSSVILNQAQKQEFVDDMREYLHPKTRRWYFDRGIPYRRGYLLHGPPGTGKTSLCFAAAGLLGLKLYLLNLKTNGLDEESMSSLFASLPRRCIVLLEDIDTAGITKTRGKTVTPGDNPVVPAPSTESLPEDDFDESSKDSITLSGLLNVIDGVAASEGRILVMTTNHPDKLDPALLRPGRVDMSISFGYMSENDIKELFASMYRFIGSDRPCTPNGPRQANGPVREELENDEDSTREPQKRDVSLDARISNLCVSFAQAIPTGELTAAEIQGYLLNYKDKPEAAVAGVAQWVEEMRKNRET
jgi:chaperone BCS1